MPDEQSEVVRSEEAEAIRQNMESTRDDLTKKVARLENKVVGTVENVTNTVTNTVDEMKSAVQETVSSVRDTVSDTVDSVKETVRSATDVSARVRESPWLTVGGAAAVGFVAGLVLFRSRGGWLWSGGHQLDGHWPHRESNRTGRVESAGHSLAAGYAAPPARTEPEKPGWLASLAGNIGEKLGEEVGNFTRKFSREIAEVEDLAARTLGGVLKQMVGQGLPHLLGQDRCEQAASADQPGAPAGAETHPAGPAPTPGPAGKPRRTNGRAQYAG